MANTNIALGITARTSGFTKSMAKARASVGTLRTSIGSLTGSVLRWTAALSPAAAAGALTLITKRSFEAIDSTAKLSDRIGLATESLIGFQRAAELSGVGAGALDKGVISLQKSVADAAMGLQTSSRAFEALGLNANELIKLPVDEQMFSVADALSKVENATDRTRIATQIFGRSGSALTVTLRDGAKGLKDSVAEVKALGIAYSRVDAAKVEAANDAMADLRSTLGGIGNTIAIEVSPLIVGMTTALTNFIKESGGLGSITAAGLESVVSVVGILGDAWNLVAGSVSVVRGAISLMIGNALAGIGELITKVGDLTGVVPQGVLDVAKGATELGVGFVKLAVEEIDGGKGQIAAALNNEFSAQIRSSIKEAQAAADIRGKQLADGLAKVGGGQSILGAATGGTGSFGKVFGKLGDIVGNVVKSILPESISKQVTPERVSPQLATAGSVEDYQIRNAARMQDRREQLEVKALEESKKQTKAIEDLRRITDSLFKRLGVASI